MAERKNGWTGGLRRCAAALLAAAVLLVPAGAAGARSGGEADPLWSASGWAQPELERARELGLLDGAGLEGELSRPIDREGFCRLALAYVAAQQRCDPAALVQLTIFYLAEHNVYGQLKSPFTDVDDTDLVGNPTGGIAYYLEIIKGSDGAFAPGRQLSRQEAAAILTRAYAVCGGELPEGVETGRFGDAEEIQDWARPSAGALAAWDVMRGDERGNFDPAGPCTVEQAAVMFLRLWENAPVGRAKGNAKQLFTYEQIMDYYRQGSFGGWVSFHVMETVEGEQATFIRYTLNGVPHRVSYQALVYRDGGMRTLDLGISEGIGGLSADTPLTDAAFSADGGTFTCTVTQKQVRWAPNPEDPEVFDEVREDDLVHHFTVDVGTGAVRDEQERVSPDSGAQQ